MTKTNPLSFYLFLIFILGPLSLQAKGTIKDPLTYKILSNGTVSICDETHTVIQIEPTLFVDGWQYHIFGSAIDQSQGINGVCDLGNGRTIQLKASVEPVPQGLHFHYTLVPNQDINCESVRIPLIFHYEEWQGCTYRLGNKKDTFTTKPFQNQFFLARSDEAPLVLGPSKSLNGLTVTITPHQTHLDLVDNRQWSPNLMAIFTQNEPVTQSWSWKAGQEKVYDFTVTIDRNLTDQPQAALSPENTLEGDWHGYFTDTGKQRDSRISAVIHKEANGSYQAHFTFDDGFLAFYSNSEPTVTFHKNVLKAVYSDGNYVELNLDPSQRSILGSVTSWGFVHLFEMQRGPDFKIPRLDADHKPVIQETYQIPADLNDGLAVGDLKEGTKSSALVLAGVNELLKGSFSNVHSLLVYHKDKLVLDEYFFGYFADQPHPLFSVTKSVFSTLFGIAQGQGLVKLDEKLYDLYPAYRSKPGWDPKKNDITLSMLMCMDSGFACDNLSDTCATDIYKSKDWLDYTLSLPLNHVPGQHWTYNGTSLIPISNWIAQKSGLSIADYAQKYLEGPLGIKSHPWETGPNQVTRVDANHWMTSREMLKLGVLYLNKGKWNGERILPKSWVAQATIPQAAKDEPRNFEYGYLFWLKSMTFGKRAVPYIEANGWGGQYIFIVPDFDLVCVMTAGNYQMGGSFLMEEQFFEKYIMNAFYKKSWRERLPGIFQ